MALLPRSIFAVLFCASCAAAQDLAALIKSFPAYTPDDKVAGTIRIWGSKHLRNIVSGWEIGFAKYHSAIRFETDLRGTASAVGGLYAGAADIALTNSDISPIDVDGFEETFKEKPFRVEILTRGLSPLVPDFALIVYVHKDNPLSSLTLSQLEAIFGSDPRRQTGIIRTWGELGLRGAWADKPIHTYGFLPGLEPARFFENAVLVGSRKWNCEMRAYAGAGQGNRDFIDGGKPIVEEAANDRYSIAYSGLHESTMLRPLPLGPPPTQDRYGIGYTSEMYKHPVIKPLPTQHEAPAFQATIMNVVERRYPLTRTISAFVRRPPGMPLQPVIKEFLTYILSAEGQEVAIRNGSYLPLSTSVLAAQRRKLE